LVEFLGEAIKQYTDTGNEIRDEWFLALLSASLDAHHDLDKALRVTLQVVQEIPEPPESELGETVLDWLPAKLK
jgi:hypothetical protein